MKNKFKAKKIEELIFSDSLCESARKHSQNHNTVEYTEMIREFARQKCKETIELIKPELLESGSWSYILEQIDFE